MVPHCTGVILAGGGATRYGGRPKGLERVDGRRIIDRVATALQGASDDLLLIANDPAAADWMPGIPTAGDVLVDVGSVAGIHAALVHAGSPVLLVAWDMPFVPTELLIQLRQQAEAQGSDVAIPESSSRRGVEPMCAYYGSRCRAAIERAIARGDRRVVAWFDDVRVDRLSAEDVSRFGDPERLFLNVNTPEDLQLAERISTDRHDCRA